MKTELKDHTIKVKLVHEALLSTRRRTTSLWGNLSPL